MTVKAKLNDNTILISFTANFVPEEKQGLVVLRDV